MSSENDTKEYKTKDKTLNHSQKRIWEPCRAPPQGGIRVVVALCWSKPSIAKMKFEPLIAEINGPPRSPIPTKTWSYRDVGKSLTTNYLEEGCSLIQSKKRRSSLLQLQIKMQMQNKPEPRTQSKTY